MSYEDDEMFDVPVERAYRFNTDSDSGTRLYGEYVAGSEAEARQMAWQDRGAYNAMEQRELRARDAMERRELQQRNAMERRHLGTANRSAVATGSGNGPGAMGTVRTAGRAMLFLFVALILIKILF